MTQTITASTYVNIQTTVQDQLLIDSNNDGKPNAGDTLRYTAYVYNIDTRRASNITFSIAPDRNTTLVNGSVTTSNGIVSSGNFAQQGRVQITISSIAPGDYVVITYRTIIKTSLAPRLMKLSTQAVISGSNVLTQSSDDPDTLTTLDATETLLSDDTQLQFHNERTLLTDTDGDGLVSAGDTVRYTVKIVNASYFDFTNAVLTNRIDAATSLDTALTTTSQGTIITGNTSGDTSLRILLGTIASGANVQINYVVTIPSTIDATVHPTVSDQPSLSFTESRTGRSSSTRLSDDPTTATLNDATITTISAASRMILTKQVSLITDVDGDNLIDPLDTLLYQVRIQNVGNIARPNNIFLNVLDAKTSLVVGSVQTSQGTVLIGNGTGHTMVYITIGDIEAQRETTITYRARVNANTRGTITSQATVSSAGLPDIITDNPHTVPSNDPTTATIGSTPTKIVLTAFNVVRNGKTHVIRWSTASEIDTWRFRIYRVTTKGIRTLVPGCSNITPRGSATRGANYQCVDRITTATTYVLEEVTRTGGSTLYQTKLRTLTRNLPVPFDREFISLSPTP